MSPLSVEVALVMADWIDLDLIILVCLLLNIIKFIDNIK